MAEFPKLKTGAVMQYPARRTASYSTRVLRFVDGSEQRYRRYGSPLKAWVIRLELLDEEELRSLEEFFLSQQGALYDFSFTDPYDNTTYPSCRLEGDAVELRFQGVHRGGTALIVRENRS